MGIHPSSSPFSLNHPYSSPCLGFLLVPGVRQTKIWLGTQYLNKGVRLYQMQSLRRKIQQHQQIAEGLSLTADSVSQHSKSFTWPWVTNYADRPQNHVKQNGVKMKHGPLKTCSSTTGRSWAWLGAKVHWHWLQHPAQPAPPGLAQPRWQWWERLLPGLPTSPYKPGNPLLTQ